MQLRRVPPTAASRRHATPSRPRKGRPVAQQPRELDPARSPADHFGANLRLLREAAGLAQAALAARIHVAKDTLGGWERARSLPPETIARTLDAALDARGTLLNDWLLARTPSTAHGPAHLERLRIALDGTLAAGAMNDSGLRDWDHTVARYAVASKDRGPAELLADLAQDIGEMRRLLERPHPATVTRHLTRVAAQLAGLTTLALVKLDDRPGFRAWARTARVAAEESGDPETCSWVLAQEAYGHYYSGDHGTAIAIAQLAQDRTRSAPRVGAALAAALEGRAHAALGDRTACTAAIGRAETVLAGLAGEATALTALGYTEAALRFHEGNALTALGDAAAAWAAQQRAIALFAPADYMDLALTRLDRAMCLVRDGDASGGAAVALEAVSALTGPRRAGIIARRARDVVGALPARQRGLPAVVELREYLSNDDEGADQW